MATGQGINITIAGDSKDAVAAFTKVVKVLDKLEKKTRETAKASEAAGKEVKKTTSETMKMFKAGVVAGAGYKALNASIALVGKTIRGTLNFLKKSTFEVAKAGDQFAKQGRVLGVTAREYQGLEFAAQRTGTTVKHIADGFKKLSRVMVDAQNGSRQIVRAFDALGVELQTVEGDLRKPLEVFKDLADRFRLMGESAERSGVSMLLLGRSGTHLLNLMSEGAAAVDRYRKRLEELGAVMSDEDTVAAESLVDDMTELNFAIKGVSYSIAHEFMPAASGIANVIRDMLVELNKTGEVTVMAEDMRRAFVEQVIPALGAFSFMSVRAFQHFDFSFKTSIIWVEKLGAKLREASLLWKAFKIHMTLRGGPNFADRLKEALGTIPEEIRKIGKQKDQLDAEVDLLFAEFNKGGDAAREVIEGLVEELAGAVGAAGALTAGMNILTDAEKKAGAALRALLVEAGILADEGGDAADEMGEKFFQTFNELRSRQVEGRKAAADMILQIQVGLDTALEGIERTRLERLRAADAMMADMRRASGALEIEDAVLLSELRKEIDRDYWASRKELREEEARAEREQILETMDAWSGALGALSNMFGAFRKLVIAGYGEESAAAKAAARKMFIMQQALALGQAIMSMAVSIGKANELGYPLSIPAMITAGATGAAQVATIAATTITGLADAGLPPDALRSAGLNSHSLIAMRNDEMVLDPVGTKYITEMLAIQKAQMGGEGEQTIVTTVELDGQVLGSAVDKRLIRQAERGTPYTGRIRQGYMGL